MKWNIALVLNNSILLSIKGLYGKYRPILLILITLYIFVFLYDCLLFKVIHPKKYPFYLRIGYVNLHESKISLSELRKLTNYNCDIWLFLEWNGDNLNFDPDFTKDYIQYQIKNKKTFGLCILTKSADVTVTEISSNQANYKCNYPKHLIRYGNDVNIFLLHAPPPVPACGFETKKYISDFAYGLVKKENLNSNIIVGDLNTLPFQAGIKILKDQGYNDSHNQITNLPEGTFGFFPCLPKIFKIDYIFYKGNIVPMYMARFSLKNSDHSGWVTDFKLLNLSISSD